MLFDKKVQVFIYMYIQSPSEQHWRYEFQTYGRIFQHAALLHTTTATNNNNIIKCIYINERHSSK